jgi:hypothetical protein
MKNNYVSVLAVFVFILGFGFSGIVKAQAFKRGSFIISLTEGSTQATYVTSDIQKGGSSEFPGYRSDETGTRDPMIIEYGISSRWGIGSTWGNDLYSINPNTFYGFNIPGQNAKVKTSEYTIDGSYHFLVTKKADFALVASFGTFSVAMKGNSNDYSYNYNSNGAIMRASIRSRYYFWRRLGVTSMGSVFSGSASPKDLKGITVGKNTSTGITGSAIEFGLCYRLCH